MKDLTQFQVQQLILIVVTKKQNICRDTRVDIFTRVDMQNSLYFSNVNSPLISTWFYMWQHSHILTTSPDFMLHA